MLLSSYSCICTKRLHYHTGIVCKAEFITANIHLCIAPKLSLILAPTKFEGIMEELVLVQIHWMTSKNYRILLKGCVKVISIKWILTSWSEAPQKQVYSTVKSTQTIISHNIFNANCISILAHGIIWINNNTHPQSTNLSLIKFIKRSRWISNFCIEIS